MLRIGPFSVANKHPNNSCLLFHHIRHDEKCLRQPQGTSSFLLVGMNRVLYLQIILEAFNLW